LIGGFFFALSNALLWSSLRLYYYKTKLSPEGKKLFAILFGAISRLPSLLPDVE
jgi:hypothetical protein